MHSHACIINFQHMLNYMFSHSLTRHKIIITASKSINSILGNREFRKIMRYLLKTCVPHHFDIWCYVLLQTLTLLMIRACPGMTIYGGNLLIITYS